MTSAALAKSLKIGAGVKLKRKKKGADRKRIERVHVALSTLFGTGLAAAPVTFSFYSAVLFSLQFRSSFRPEVRPAYARTLSCHKVDFRRVWHRQSQSRVQWPCNFNLTPQNGGQILCTSDEETMLLTKFLPIISELFRQIRVHLTYLMSKRLKNKPVIDKNERCP